MRFILLVTCILHFNLFCSAESELAKFLSTEHDKLCLGLQLGFSTTDYLNYQLEFGQFSPWPQVGIHACIGDFPFALDMRYAFSWNTGTQATDVGGITQNVVKWKSWEVLGGLRYYDAYKSKLKHYWTLGTLGREEEMVRYGGSGGEDMILRSPRLGLGFHAGTGLEWAFTKHMVAELNFRFSRARTEVYGGGLMDTTNQACPRLKD